MTTNELDDKIDLLDCSDISKLFHLTENAVRIHIHRKSGVLPDGFKIGRRWFWSHRKVAAWLELRA